MARHGILGKWTVAIIYLLVSKSSHGDESCLRLFVFGIGPAQLMMALTAEGQLDPKLDEARERDEGISTQKKKEERKDYFEPYQPHEGADNWQSGTAVQVKPEEVPFKTK